MPFSSRAFWPIYDQYSYMKALRFCKTEHNAVNSKTLQRGCTLGFTFFGNSFKFVTLFLSNSTGLLYFC